MREIGAMERSGAWVWLNQLELGCYAPVFEIHEVDDGFTDVDTGGSQGYGDKCSGFEVENVMSDSEAQRGVFTRLVFA